MEVDEFEKGKKLCAKVTIVAKTGVRQYPVGHAINKVTTFIFDFGSLSLASTRTTNQEEREVGTSKKKSVTGQIVTTKNGVVKRLPPV